jgi:hypothetical protein
MAHGAGGDAQLLGCQRYAAQARQGLKGQEALDGRDACSGNAPTIIRGPQGRAPCFPYPASCGSFHV